MVVGAGVGSASSFLVLFPSNAASYHYNYIIQSTTNSISGTGPLRKGCRFEVMHMLSGSVNPDGHVANSFGRYQFAMIVIA